MKPTTRTLKHELRQAMIFNSISLDIIAKRLTDQEWELSIVNTLGISSIWTEFFATGQAAINAGIEAIKSEGYEDFTDIEDFEYLVENQSDR